LYLRYVPWHKSPRRYQFNVNTQSFKGTLGWNANSTLGSLSITDPFDTADTQNCAYTHDDLTRIASVNCGASTWQQTFSYDAFGNLTKSVPTGGTGNSFQPTYNAKNQYATLPGSTPSYDANGNVLTDGSELGLPDLGGDSDPGGQGGQRGGGVNTQGGTTTILKAVNNHFGTNFTSAKVTGDFQYSFGAPAGQGTFNLNISGGGVSPGRYPVNWWTYIIGYGSTLHIPAGPFGLDSPQTLPFSSSQFTAHLDSAYPYNPIGLLIHELKDVKGVGGFSPCP
jgi:hypothetical protein